MLIGIPCPYNLGYSPKRVHRKVQRSSCRKGDFSGFSIADAPARQLGWFCRENSNDCSGRGVYNMEPGDPRDVGLLTVICGLAVFACIVPICPALASMAPVFFLGL